MEGTLMIDLKHENVMSLVGVVWDEGHIPLIVLPYMENGDLHGLVRSPAIVSNNLLILVISENQFCRLCCSSNCCRFP